jgi:hypothetical protein
MIRSIHRTIRRTVSIECLARGSAGHDPPNLLQDLLPWQDRRGVTTTSAGDASSRRRKRVVASRSRRMHPGSGACAVPLMTMFRTNRPVPAQCPPLRVTRSRARRAFPYGLIRALAVRPRRSHANGAWKTTRCPRGRASGLIGTPTVGGRRLAASRSPTDLLGWRRVRCATAPVTNSTRPGNVRRRARGRQHRRALVRDRRW